jgi:deazaflavin-dependent oxidoreductase (nitroreductase family)
MQECPGSPKLDGPRDVAIERYLGRYTHAFLAVGTSVAAEAIRRGWRLGNRIEAFQLRRLGVSPMSLLNRGDVMLLETIGRRTGKRRFTHVGYWEAEGGLVVGGGAAGMGTVPDWVRNLRHDPHGAVWIRRSRTSIVAHELTGDDRHRAQDRATAIWPEYPDTNRSRDVWFRTSGWSRLENPGERTP